VQILKTRTGTNGLLPNHRIREQRRRKQQHTGNIFLSSKCFCSIDQIDDDYVITITYQSILCQVFPFCHVQNIDEVAIKFCSYQ